MHNEDRYDKVLLKNLHLDLVAMIEFLTERHTLESGSHAYLLKDARLVVGDTIVNVMADTKIVNALCQKECLFLSVADAEKFDHLTNECYDTKETVCPL